jgi:hypothetical protein
VPALLVVVLLIFGGLSWARLQRGTVPRLGQATADAELPQQALNADLAASTAAPLLICTSTPADTASATPTPSGVEVESQSCVQLTPTPTPFSPAEIATATHWAAQTQTALPSAPDFATSQAATATMAQILATDQAIRGPTDLAATATAAQVWIITMTAVAPTSAAETSIAATESMFATLSPTSAAETSVAATATQIVRDLTATAVVLDPARATAEDMSTTATAMRATDYAQTATASAAIPIDGPTDTPTAWTPVTATPCEQSASLQTATPTASATPTPIGGEAQPSACATPTPPLVPEL